MLSHAVSMAVTVGLLCGTMVAGASAYGVETGQRGAQGTTETGQRAAGDADNALAGKSDVAETGEQTDSTNPTESGDSSDSAGQTESGEPSGSEGQGDPEDPSSDKTTELGESSEPSEDSQPSGNEQLAPSTPDSEKSDETTDSSADTKQKVNFDEHTVKNTVSPSGTTINLFDYWMENRDSVDTGKNGGDGQPNWVAGSDIGIDKEHDFKFVYGGSGCGNMGNPPDYSKCGINSWTGSGGGPRTGIVERQLVSGMPKLASTNGESLSYLFDPADSSESSAYRAAHRNVGNLLQVDDDKYYYYDSQQNFASYDEASNKFKLYDSWAVMKHTDNNAIPNGQFFPFNDAQTVFDGTKTENGKLVANPNVKNTDAKLNHWFGMTMSTRFVQPKDGIVQDAQQDMSYEFSGDDDVWIFIDDVLVGDLGGIHDANRIKIDFKTGDVITYSKLNEGNPDGKELSRTTIRDQFTAAGAENEALWAENKDTFADNTYHTLKFFYLERGNFASNMKLRFNLVTVPESQIVKVDQVGNPIEGVSFELYGQTYDDKNDTWVDGAKTLVAEGTTDENGALVLVDPQTETPISFDEVYDKKGYIRYRLHEVNPPQGYRSAGDVLLEYHPAEDANEFGGYVTSLQGNEWQTGAYANAGVLVSAPHDIYKASSVGTKGEQISEESLKQGTLFAMVLKYEGIGKAGLNDTHNWKIVSGDSLNGWTTAPEGSGVTDIGTIAQAAREGKGHRFLLNSSGSYETNIEELPGDISTYYNMLKGTGGDIGNTKYTVAYYFTDGSLADANAGNTHRLFIEDTNGTAPYQRKFSVNLHVPNIKNSLYVQKTDEDYQPITKRGEKLTAQFALYKADQVNSEGKLIDNARPYDTVTTQKSLSVNGKYIMDSAAAFPSDGKVLEEGAYYLKEVKAPDGYTLHDGLTKVVVTSDGVYADAGQDNDGVRVRSGVGQLVRTMARFATSDQIDATLSDIIAELRTGGEPSYSQQKGWQYSWNDESSAGSMNLSYKNSAALLEYGVTGSTDQRPSYEDVTLMNDVGWSTLSITQHYDDYCIQTGDEGIKGCVSSINKQHLVDAQNKPISLNNLFTGSTTIQIANHAGPELPATGGMGTRTLLWSGLLLVGISLSGLAYARRRW